MKRLKDINREALDQFLSNIPTSDIVRLASTNCNKHADELLKILNTFINESRTTFDLIENQLNPDLKYLEVGAGLCLLSMFLKSQGINITALEPALGGFGAFDALRNALFNHYPGISLTVLECPAQDLCPELHGQFDMIFSNNVLEHIPDWEAALVAMLSVLAPKGSMRHACPNYTIPYEPHYGIMVFHAWPKFSRQLFLPKSANPEIWESLNFIRYWDIRCFCKNRNLNCSFEKKLLFKSFMRILDDPLFESRHQGIIATLAHLLHKSRLLGLLKFVPPALATPMAFEISRLQTLED